MLSTSSNFTHGSNANASSSSSGLHLLSAAVNCIHSNGGRATTALVADNIVYLGNQPSASSAQSPPASTNSMHNASSARTAPSNSVNSASPTERPVDSATAACRSALFAAFLNAQKEAYSSPSAAPSITLTAASSSAPVTANAGAATVVSSTRSSYLSRDGSDDDSSSGGSSSRALPLKKRLKMMDNHRSSNSSSTFASASSSSSWMAAPSAVHAVSVSGQQSNVSCGSKRSAPSLQAVEQQPQNVGMGFNMASNAARASSPSCTVVSDRSCGNKKTNSRGKTAKTSVPKSKARKSKSVAKLAKSPAVSKTVPSSTPSSAKGACARSMWHQQLQENFKKEWTAQDATQAPSFNTPAATVPHEDNYFTVSPQESRAPSPSSTASPPTKNTTHHVNTQKAKNQWHKQLQANFNKEVRTRALEELRRNCSAASSSAGASMTASTASSSFMNQPTESMVGHYNNTHNSSSCAATTTSCQDPIKNQLYQAYLRAMSQH